MKKGIIICGMNGSGKSSIAKQFSEVTDYTYLDVEDFYFPNRNSDNPYSVIRTKKEAEKLILEKMQSTDRFVLASVKGDFCAEICECLTDIVLIEVDKQTRIERMRQRSYLKFGQRMMKGGDLYEQEENFIQKMAQRYDDDAKQWAEGMNLPILMVDGTKEISENVQIPKEHYGC